MPRVWWCNQTRCWNDERPAGLVCSHIAATESGMKYRRMVNEARAGDITIHYRSGRWKKIVALESRVDRSGRGYGRLEAVRGDGEGVLGAAWARVAFEAEYYDLARPIPKSEVIEELNGLEIEDGPIDFPGHIRQAYFMRFSAEGLHVLRRASAEDWPDWAEAAAPPQYWVVGASWSGREDQYEEFIREGYWLLGWSEDEQPSQAARRDSIQPGDHIAIKKISRKPNIEICALGVVRGIDPEDQRVHVRWLKTGLNHQVYSRGCYQSIHGPYEASDPWIREIFRLDAPNGVSDESGLPDCRR